MTFSYYLIKEKEWRKYDEVVIVGPPSRNLDRPLGELPVLGTGAPGNELRWNILRLADPLIDYPFEKVEVLLLYGVVIKSPKEIIME